MFRLQFCTLTRICAPRDPVEFQRSFPGHTVDRHICRGRVGGWGQGERVKCLVKYEFLINSHDSNSQNTRKAHSLNLCRPHLTEYPHVSERDHTYWTKLEKQRGWVTELRGMEPCFRPRSRDPQTRTRSATFLLNAAASWTAFRRKKKKNFFLTKSAPPARLWPPINTAVAWSYNQNGIWKGNSSWQNEKHIPLNPTLSNAHNGLRTPILTSPWISTNSRAFLEEKVSSWLSTRVTLKSLWFGMQSREQTFKLTPYTSSLRW